MRATRPTPYSEGLAARGTIRSAEGFVTTTTQEDDMQTTEIPARTVAAFGPFVPSYVAPATVSAA